VSTAMVIIVGCVVAAVAWNVVLIVMARRAPELEQDDPRGYSDAELARWRRAVAERRVAAGVRPRSGQVTPLGGDRPPTAYGTDTDGLGPT
jgi:hypothetical protein